MSRGITYFVIPEFLRAVKNIRDPVQAIIKVSTLIKLLYNAKLIKLFRFITSGCRIPVVRLLWEQVDWVQFPAARPRVKEYYSFHNHPPG